MTLGSGITLGRYMWLNYIIDDTSSACFPDATCDQTNITNYDIYFTPNASLRLRGGQTFTTQKERGLEASPL
jgi:hypothetical protein